MIPDNSEELSVLAGEFVLGVLDAHESDEVAAALAVNAELRRAVVFWERRLHPLSSLAISAEPPSGTWQAIEARIRTKTAKPVTKSFWTNLALWRWSTAGFAAAAAALALWIAAKPVPGPSLVLRAVTTATPPSDRAFELWAIAPGATQPRSLGVISPNGELKLSRLPADLRDGATLAISIEPIGGSPTQLPSGPVVYIGSVKAV